MKVIITAPSLDPTQNVSGVSSVVNFIIGNNKGHRYIHFELGKKDNERGGVARVASILKGYRQWKKTLRVFPEAIIHYSFPLSARLNLRDCQFMRYAYKTSAKNMFEYIPFGSGFGTFACAAATKEYSPLY